MKKSEADLNLIREKNREAVEKLPKVEGGNIYLSQSANKILLDAPNIAKQMGDEYVTIEHLWLSLLEVNSEVSKILKDFGVTKNHKKPCKKHNKLRWILAIKALNLNIY